MDDCLRLNALKCRKAANQNIWPPMMQLISANSRMWRKKNLRSYRDFFIRHSRIFFHRSPFSSTSAELDNRNEQIKVCTNIFLSFYLLCTALLLLLSLLLAFNTGSYGVSFVANSIQIKDKTKKTIDKNHSSARHSGSCTRINFNKKKFTKK